MSVAIRTRKVEDGKHRITAYHQNPEKMSEEELEEVTVIDSLPEKEKKEGKSALMFYDPESGDTWVEYEDKPEESEGSEVEEKLDEILEVLERIEDKL